jgi:serine/threonine protein kinase
MLVDFGIAKLYDRQVLTTVGARAFTPGYSPPEQYGKGATDERSDIYALGATLYTLLTNLTPPDSVDVMAGNASPIPPVHVLNPQVSRTVGVAIAQAMETDRTRRFHSVDEFKTSLHASLSPAVKTKLVDQKTSSKPAHKPTLVVTRRILPGSRLPSRSKRKSRWSSRSIIVYLAALLIVVLLSLLMTFGAMWLQSGGKATESQAVGQITSQPGGGGVTLETPTQASMAPTDVPTPAETPIIPPEAGAVLIDFPQTRIAFASDHAGDRKDRIYVYNLQPCQYWLAPMNDFQYNYQI